MLIDRFYLTLPPADCDVVPRELTQVISKLLGVSLYKHATILCTVDNTARKAFSLVAFVVLILKAESAVIKY